MIYGLIVVMSMSIALNIIAGFLIIKGRDNVKKLTAGRRNWVELLKVQESLNVLGGGMVEIRRIDPSTVFLRSPL